MGIRVDGKIVSGRRYDGKVVAGIRQNGKIKYQSGLPPVMYVINRTGDALAQSDTHFRAFDLNGVRVSDRDILHGNETKQLEGLTSNSTRLFALNNTDDSVLSFGLDGMRYSSEDVDVGNPATGGTSRVWESIATSENEIIVIANGIASRFDSLIRRFSIDTQAQIGNDLTLDLISSGPVLSQLQSLRGADFFGNDLYIIDGSQSRVYQLSFPSLEIESQHQLDSLDYGGLVVTADRIYVASNPTLSNDAVILALLHDGSMDTNASISTGFDLIDGLAYTE